MTFEHTSIIKAIQGKKVLPGASTEQVTKFTSPENPRAKMARMITGEGRSTFVGRISGGDDWKGPRDLSHSNSNTLDVFSRRDISTKASNDSTGQFNDQIFHETFMEIVEIQQSLPYLPEKLLLSEGQKKEILSIDMHANPQQLSEELQMPFLEARGRIFGAHTGERAVQPLPFPEMWAQLPEKSVSSTLRLDDNKLNAKEEITIEKNNLSSLSFSENFRLSVEVSTLHSEDHFVCKKIYKPKNHWEKEFNILIGTNNIKNILEALPHGYTVKNLNLQELSHSDEEKSYKIMLNFKHTEKQE